jgi:hypothetical protein
LLRTHTRLADARDSTSPCVCVCVCVHVYLHIFRKILSHLLTHAHVHTRAHARAHTHLHECIQTSIALIDTHSHSHTHPHAHAHTHTQTHTHTNTHTHTHTNTHTRHLDLGRRNDPRGTRGAHTRALTHTPSLSCVLCVCVRVCVRARTHTRHCHLGGSPDPRGVVDEGPHRVVLGVVTRGVAVLWARVCSRFGLRVCVWRDACVCVCACVTV